MTKKPRKFNDFEIEHAIGTLIKSGYAIITPSELKDKAENCYGTHVEEVKYYTKDTFLVDFGHDFEIIDKQKLIKL